MGRPPFLAAPPTTGGSACSLPCVRSGRFARDRRVRARARVAVHARRRVLRLLRRQSRREAVQRSLAGDPGARRESNRDQHAQRLPGRPVRIRARRARAGRTAEEPDPCRRSEDLRAHRCVQRASACRILRPQPVRSRQDDARLSARNARGGAGGAHGGAEGKATRRWGSPSRRATPSANTTSPFFRRPSRTAWKRGCARAATTSPPRRARRCNRTSART